MADTGEHAGTVTVTNGVGRRPANGADGARPTRDQVIADLARMQSSEEKPAPTEKPAEPEVADESQADETADEATQEQGEQADESKADETASKADPDLQKRLAIVAKHERRAKEQAAQMKAAIDEERATLRRDRDSFEREIQSMRSEMQAFAKAKERARYNPAEALRALGLTDEDMGPAARHIWAQTKEQAADPKNREAAAMLMRERETSDRVAKLEQELANQRKASEEREQAIAAQRQIDGYLADIPKAIKDEHPLARRLIEKSPERAKQRFAVIAHRLAERDGELPDADDVIAEYEKQRRAELEEDGVDVATMFKVKSKPRTEEPRTLGNDVGTTTAPKGSSSNAPKKTQLEKRAELERELREMELKSR